MGEAKRKLSATQKFVQQFPSCYFCGGKNASATREHMPPKSLFDNAYRPDRLVMPACDECNRGTSTADLTAAIVSRWGYEISSQSLADHNGLIHQMRRQAPDLATEWESVMKFGVENAREHLRQHGVAVPADAGIRVIGPLTICQLNLFAHKATLALYFEHFRQPLPPAGGTFSLFRTKEDYAVHGFPPALLEIMPRYGTLIQGKWDTRETFEYRYEVNIDDGLFGCIAKLRRGLFVLGFATVSATELADAADWVNPAKPTYLLKSPRFHQKE